jgi:hypothetical protein
MGTAILISETERLMVLEKVEKSVFEELQEQAGNEDCTCSINETVVHFGKVSPVLWSENDIDWDYGY